MKYLSVPEYLEIKRKECGRKLTANTIYSSIRKKKIDTDGANFRMKIKMTKKSIDWQPAKSPTRNAGSDWWYPGNLKFS